MRVEQRTKYPEAGPFYQCIHMFTVIIGYPRNFQIRVIKLIRGSKVLKGRSTANQILEIKRIKLLCFRTIFFSLCLEFFLFTTPQSSGSLTMAPKRLTTPHKTFWRTKDSAMSSSDMLLNSGTLFFKKAYIWRKKVRLTTGLTCVFQSSVRLGLKRKRLSLFRLVLSMRSA